MKVDNLIDKFIGRADEYAVVIKGIRMLDGLKQAAIEAIDARAISHCNRFTVA